MNTVTQAAPLPHPKQRGRPRAHTRIAQAAKATAGTAGHSPAPQADTPKPQPFANFDTLADTALVRLRQLVRDPNRPHEPPVIPCSAATWWRWIAAGTAPAPVKLGSKTTCWRVSDIRAWLRAQSAEVA